LSPDYDLGCQFARVLKASSGASAPSLNPYRLSGLLADVAASDQALVSAFRLLLGQPLFVEFFSGRQPGQAQYHSLVALAQESLAPALALRVAEFLDGYLAHFTGGSAGPVTPFPVNFQADLDIQPTVVVEDLASPSNPSQQEPATVYAPDSSPSSAHSASIPEPITRTPGAKLPIKALVLFGFSCLALFAVFKVPALCEPFGLCSDSGSEQEDGPTKKKSSVKPSAPTTEPQALQDQPKSLPPSTPSARPSSPRSDWSGSSQSMPASPPPSAPLREEPLW